MSALVDYAGLIVLSGFVWLLIAQFIDRGGER